MRYRGRRADRLSGAAGRSRATARLGGACLILAVLFVGCGDEEPDVPPDPVLQEQLGLTAEDRVHRVTLTGGGREQAVPDSLGVEPGAYVEFFTDDWLIHEVIFERDSLSAEQWAFLERTDQVASPPLLQRESRYVLSFENAPIGRYPYTLEGNGRSGTGEIRVVESLDR